MYIAKFQVSNYKSFHSSQELTLTPGFNVIVGQNNVGKTALAEAMSLHYTDNPHRSMKTVLRPGLPVPNASTVNIAFQLVEGEIEQLLIESAKSFFVPVGARPQDESLKFQVLLHESSHLQCVYQPPNSFTSAYLESYGNLPNPQNTVMFTVDISQHQLKNQAPTINDRNSNPKYGSLLAETLHKRIYLFKAERLGVSTYSMGLDNVLSPDARNLAMVLHNLQSKNPSRFRRFNEYVSIIFPKIKGITVPSGPSNGQVQIVVWSIDTGTERDDLAIPLSDSGTGIGQILAMLYVILTAEYPQVIIIDEPQSFLNPGAVRKLIEILKQHSQHQYIITTHSPEIVSMTNPETLFLLRNEEAETIIEPLNSKESRAQQLCLTEVGARLGDVFGADNILWVEGATEELCFPLIVEKIISRPLLGTKILGVVQTGDFESRHSELIFQIYDRLTKGNGLIPPAIGFIFDKEGRSEKDQEDLKRRSHDSIVFLPSRMYENYLLNPQAIAYVASHIEGFRDETITSEEVEDWLERNRSDRKYYEQKTSEAERMGDTWIQTVHGAKILADIFREFSDCRVGYDKVLYGLALTEWIVENAPNDLDEVAEVIQSMLSSNKVQEE
jgi:predicted ATPase